MANGVFVLNQRPESLSFNFFHFSNFSSRLFLWVSVRCDSDSDQILLWVTQVEFFWVLKLFVPVDLGIVESESALLRYGQPLIWDQGLSGEQCLWIFRTYSWICWFVLKQFARFFCCTTIVSTLQSSDSNSRIRLRWKQCFQCIFTRTRYWRVVRI